MTASPNDGKYDRRICATLVPDFEYHYKCHFKLDVLNLYIRIVKKTRKFKIEKKII